MSSKIYFSDKSGKGILGYLIYGIASALYFFFPKYTETQLRKFLLKPNNRKAKPIPSYITHKHIETKHGPLAVFEAGDSKHPKILFTHGWSGASSQFYELMNNIANKGYHCIAFDHYAHHLSGGKECNFPLFIIGLKNVIEALNLNNNLHCVVSHSMGVAGTVNVFHGKDTPHFFIAPFFDFWHELSSRVTGVGIPETVFHAVARGIERDYEILIKSLEPNLHVKNIKSPIHIIHDPEDKFALYQFSEKYSNEFNNLSLEKLNNVGHMRIIKDAATLNALSKFIDETIP